MRNLKIQIIEGKGKEEISAPAEIFGVKSSPFLIAQASRVFLSNQRRAKGVAKGRGDIAGSGVKIWRQKGTGRARHGDRKAPIFVGGGSAHGPTGEQNYHLSLNLKMSRKAVRAILSSRLKEKKLFLFKGEKIKKTKDAFEFIKDFKQRNSVKKNILLVFGRKEELKRNFSNLDKIKDIRIDNLNVFDLLAAEAVIMTQKAFEEYILKKNDDK